MVKERGRHHHVNDRTSALIPVQGGPIATSKLEIKTRWKKHLTKAYIPETNTCKTLIKIMTEKDFMQFTQGKPSVHGLTHAHSYPINVQCHNGVKDPKGRWCLCNSGWDSAEFDHRNFNLDVQVYHMCTVWMGKMTAEQAKNITVQMINRHAITAGVIVSFLTIIHLSVKFHLKPTALNADTMTELVSNVKNMLWYSRRHGAMLVLSSSFRWYSGVWSGRKTRHTERFMLDVAEISIQSLIGGENFKVEDWRENLAGFSLSLTKVYPQNPHFGEDAQKELISNNSGIRRDRGSRLHITHQSEFLYGTHADQCDNRERSLPKPWFHNLCNCVLQKF
ncbi:uncharacterized protein TNCV_2276621 [Trichonephila clavipes]|nr:uncharacterized protein TNCV_2276621 [Trichonephila clavipes]